MSLAERNPTEVAPCGCPYDPEYDAGSLGWHQRGNHPEATDLSELDARSDDSNSPADLTPDAERSSGETWDGIDLVTLLADTAALQETVEHLLAFDARRCGRSTPS